MSNKRRQKLFSGARRDLSHDRALESSVTADFSDLLNGIFTGLDKPYIIRGMDIVPSTAGSLSPVTSLTIRMADSVLLHPQATEPGTILAIPADEPDQIMSNNTKIIGNWTQNAVNYLSIDYRRVVDPETVDVVAGWSVTDKTELSKTVATGYILDYRFVISTSGYGTNLPLYKVTLDGSGNMTAIENGRNHFFRLGSGGANPNPSNNYAWALNAGSRIEGSVSTSNLSSNSSIWSSGDYGIKNMKDAFDALATRIKEISGSTYWYVDNGAAVGVAKNLQNTWWDSNGSVMTSEGYFSLERALQLGYNNSRNPTDIQTHIISSYTLYITTSSGGIGQVHSLSGVEARIQATTGTFSIADTYDFYFNLTPSNISRSGTTATVTVPDARIFAPIYASPGYGSTTFVGSIAGADQSNFNRTDVLFTIVDATHVSYTVSNSGDATASGTLTMQARLKTSIGGSSGTVNQSDLGPLTWSADVNVRSIIGGLMVTLNSTATALPSGTADTFGAGTLEFNNDNQVAYLRLERNIPLGVSGTTYNITNNGSTTVVTGTPFTYVDSSSVTQNLAVGDYLKVDNESEDHWFRVSNLSPVTLVNIAGGNPTTTQRPSVAGAKLVVSKGNYSTINVANAEDVPATGDIYWFAYRKDKSSSPVVYLRNLELSIGEQRNVNDNSTQNLLLYTGAQTEAAINPEYSLSTSGNWEFESTVSINSGTIGVDTVNNTIYLAAQPPYGIQAGDLMFDPASGITLTVAYPLNGTTAVFKENGTGFATSGSIKYRRPDYAIADEDNLTRAIRKLDRLMAKISTVTGRPIYDESLFIQKITISTEADSSSTIIRSGYYITTSAGGLAWVVAASNTTTNQEVKDPTAGTTIASALLIHVISDPGSAFVSGVTITQSIPGVSSATRTITSATPTAPAIYGDSAGVGANGQILRLPPNTRVSIPDNGLSGPRGGKVYPMAAFNTASAAVGGGELLVVINDTPRECAVDYIEAADNGPAIFAGSGSPISNAAAIKLVRSMPTNTRIRFRNLATFGLTPPSGTSVVNLQSAYNAGNTISTAAATPVQIVAGSASEVALNVSNGRIQISSSSGSGIQPAADKGSQVGFDIKRFANVWTQQVNVKTHDNVTGSEWVQRTAAIQTTTAALVTADTYTLPDPSAYRFTVTAVGRRLSGGPDSAMFRMEFAAYREGSGAVLLGSPSTTIIAQSSNAGAYVIVPVVSGNDVQIQVAGDTGQTVQWALTIDYQRVSTAV